LTRGRGLLDSTPNCGPYTPPVVPPPPPPVNFKVSYCEMPSPNDVRRIQSQDHPGSVALLHQRNSNDDTGNSYIVLKSGEQPSKVFCMALDSQYGQPVEGWCDGKSMTAHGCTNNVVDVWDVPGSGRIYWDVKSGGAGHFVISVTFHNNSDHEHSFQIFSE